VLFGEGIINDAVAIILFNTINKTSFEDKQTIGVGTVLLIVGDFFYLLSMSLLIGLIFGFGLSYFLKKSQSFVRYPIK
jgi:NhaP-type Na+/H+ or K+/H+ antiporter